MTIVPNQQQRLRHAFERVTGYWHPACEQIPQASPHYFEAYIDCIEVPWKNEKRPYKVKKLV